MGGSNRIKGCRGRLTPWAQCDTFCASSATQFKAEPYGQKTSEYHG